MFWRNLLTTSVQTTAAAAVGSAASAGVDSRWYRELRKPAVQPPGAAFPIVWTALYADVAVTSAAVLTGLQRQALPTLHHRTPSPSVAAGREDGYRRALVLNLALNAGWSWVFFTQHDTALATVTAAALTASTADLARRAAQVRPRHGVALLPYVGWCGFATVLSARIHQLNA